MEGYDVFSYSIPLPSKQKEIMHNVIINSFRRQMMDEDSSNLLEKVKELDKIVRDGYSSPEMQGKLYIK